MDPEEEENDFVDDEEEAAEARDASDTTTVVPTADVTYDGIDEDMLVPSVPVFLGLDADDYHHEDDEDNQQQQQQNHETRTTVLPTSSNVAGNIDANDDALWRFISFQ